MTQILEGSRTRHQRRSVGQIITVMLAKINLDEVNPV